MDTFIQLFWVFVEGWYLNYIQLTSFYAQNSKSMGSLENWVLFNKWVIFPTHAAT